MFVNGGLYFFKHPTHPNSSMDDGLQEGSQYAPHQVFDMRLSCGGLLTTLLLIDDAQKRKEQRLYLIELHVTLIILLDGLHRNMMIRKQPNDIDKCSRTWMSWQILSASSAADLRLSRTEGTSPKECSGN
jgi:hypothetical protein